MFHKLALWPKTGIVITRPNEVTQCLSPSYVCNIRGSGKCYVCVSSTTGWGLEIGYSLLAVPPDGDHVGEGKGHFLGEYSNLAEASLNQKYSPTKARLS